MKLNSATISIRGKRGFHTLLTLASLTLIILFSENVENFKNYFFQVKKYCEGK
jgi:hypothetical protein